MTDRFASGAARPSSEADSGLFADGLPSSSSTPSSSDSTTDGSGFGAGLDDDSRAEATGTLNGSGPRRKRRRGRRSKAPAEQAQAADGAAVAPGARSEAGEETPPGGPGGPGGEERPRRKRRRRRSRSDKSDRPEDGPDASAAAATAPATSGAPSAEPGARSRRRRGTRAGSRRKKAGPVELEGIPGEEDELTPPESAELPDLPEDAEVVDETGVATPRKKRRRRRSRSSRGTDSSGSDEAPRSRKVKQTRKRSERTEPEKAAAPAVPNQILVNAADREETRVAVVERGRITDFSMTVDRHHTLVNDIYRGRVVNLEPAIGAAFIDFGQGRNGFLHTSDVLTAYGDEDWSLDKLLTTHVDLEDWEQTSQPPVGEELTGGEGEQSQDGEEPGGPPLSEDSGEDAGSSGTKKKVVKKRGRKAQRRSSRQRARPRLPITELLQKGQSVVVQVTKDAIGDKGPALTTYISIPGRYLVLMPSMARTGVSRKIEDEKERRRLKRILESFDIPAGMGVIVRTAGVGATKVDLMRDLDYLLLLWESFGERLNLGRGPAPLYEESDVAIRTIRDLFDESTEAVVVDDPEVHARVSEFTERLMPENTEKVEFHEEPRPLFHHFGIEQDFEKIFARRVDLPSGGSIVFDQTEALVAIDVNSGKTRSDGFDFEEVALKTNLDAVPEIARQIRLRDLGGIIVIDFIDMLKTSNRRTVEKVLRGALAPDRARSKIGRISQFGLLELTRQRLGPGMSKMLFHNCSYCRGSGKQRTVESKVAAILRRLGSALTLKGFSKVEVRTQPETIEYLRRHYSQDLKNLEQRHDRELTMVEVQDQIEDCVLRYLRADGREVRPGGRKKR